MLKTPRREPSRSEQTAITQQLLKHLYILRNKNVNADLSLFGTIDTILKLSLVQVITKS
jgi:hypothetical protein